MDTGGIQYTCVLLSNISFDVDRQTGGGGSVSHGQLFPGSDWSRAGQLLCHVSVVEGGTECDSDSPESRGPVPVPQVPRGCPHVHHRPGRVSAL